MNDTRAFPFLAFAVEVFAVFVTAAAKRLEDFPPQTIRHIGRPPCQHVIELGRRRACRSFETGFDFHRGQVLTQHRVGGERDE